MLMISYRFGIRCNVVLPGFIETPMTDTMPANILEHFKELVPLGRTGKPEGE